MQRKSRNDSGISLPLLPPSSGALLAKLIVTQVVRNVPIAYATHVHQSKPTTTIPSQFNPAHLLAPYFSRVKVKLSPCLSDQNAMKTYGGVDAWIHVFSTSALVGGEWSASRTGRLIPQERAPGTH
jgi:hypothetical protein